MKTLLSHFLVCLHFFAIAQVAGEFDGISPQQQSEVITYPESHAFQLLGTAGMALTDGTTMGTLNDFTGFVPKNGSSTEGYLCINHEFIPGGVTILEIKLNETTKRWEILSSGSVDFSEFSAACGIGGGTMINCSGGVTPWGTMVTSEENTIGVCQYEGYSLMGWNVEINPATREIIDYDNNGTPDKLWALGRMRHENVCFAPDSIRVFQGEDASSTGYVYKFVADNKANLSSGSLYVLKLNEPLDGTGQWLQVPNATVADRNNTVSLAQALDPTDFDRVEDIEWGPDGKVYVSSTGQSRIYRFDDSGNSVSNFEVYVDNIPYSVQTTSGTGIETMSKPDNLAFDPQDNLWIMCDGNVNYTWMVSPDHTPASPNIRIFSLSPAYSEPTGTTFTPDGKWMFISQQVKPDAVGLNEETQYDVDSIAVVYNTPITMVFSRKENFDVNYNSIGSVASKESGFELVTLYPNPAKDVVNIEATYTRELQINARIVDMTGKAFATSIYNLVEGKNQFTISISGLTAGQYMIEFTAEDRLIGSASFTKL